MVRPQVVSIAAAARLAHVSRHTIYAWMTKGQVQFVITPSGRRRIVVASLPANIVWGT